MEEFDVVVVGSGPAGLSAGMYAGRFDLKTVVIGSQLGGYASLSGTIYNYPGIKNADGYSLAKTMKEQAKEFGTIFYDENVLSIKKDGNFFVTEIKGKQIKSFAVIIATGSERKKLEIEGEDKYEGKGIHYCVTCDGPIYSGKEVVVVGGGNSAVKGAILISEYASRIYMIVRGKELKAEPANMNILNKISDKIQFLYETNIVGFEGNGKLKKVLLDKEYNDSKELSIDAVFVEIGSRPVNALAKDLGVFVDEKGYVPTNGKMETNISGVFVAGDLSDLFGSFKQNITASATGSSAANSAYKYIKSVKP